MPPTFASTLAARLRTDPGQPLVTFYDDATGERVELSVTTYANWVAKTAALLVDELGVERGQTIRVDLPTHWLGPVFLGAAWTAGLVVTWTDQPDVVVTGPTGLERWRGHELALACSLLPLGRPFPETPEGFVDVGREVWGQPDAFVPWDPPTSEDPAVADPVALTQAELLDRADGVVPPGVRVLTDRNPAAYDGLSAFVVPLVTGGSTVWAVNAAPDSWEHRAATEQAETVASDSGQP